MCTIVIRKYDSHKIFNRILMILLGCFLTFFLVTNGPCGYQTILFLLYPPAAYFLLGRHVASAITGFFIAVALIFFLFPNHFPVNCQYDNEFKFVFLTSFFFVSMISFAFETAKSRYQREIEKKDQQLTRALDKVAAANKYNRSIITAKSEFLANMSHELRTPLNHMIGFTELVVDQKFGELNQIQREYLNDALQSSKYLFALINDILDLKRVETGKQELEISEIDIKSFIESSLVMIREKALNHGIQVSIDLGRAPIAIRADKGKLRQVMYNLLSNAAKFTPDGGLVTISARKTEVDCQRVCHNDGAKVMGLSEKRRHAGGSGEIVRRHCVEFAVADSGIGIKPVDLERIFKRFEQADGSSRKKFQGTGLGLSLSKKYVELHGGQIWAESEGQAKGSIFKFVIPF